MKKNLLFQLSLIVLLSCAARASAGFYQFTLTGHVTQSTHANVSVGDPFTIRYVADSFDRDPSPTFGSYAATPATAEYPNVTTTSFGVSPSVTVSIFPDGFSRVEYLHAAGIDTLFQVHFAFPPSILDSDALPLVLPSGTVGVFGESRGPGGYSISGTVASYSSVEVPEPCVSALSLLPILLLCRRSRVL